MPPSKGEYLSKLAELATQAERAQSSERAMIRTSVAHAEKLVGSPEWDAYQQQLQAKINLADAQVKSLTEQLVHPSTGWDPATMGMLKGSLNGWIARRDALREAQMLPHEVIKTYRGERDER